jgi:hypothetical protein
MLDPCSSAKGVGRFAGEVALFDSLRILHDRPAITRQIRPVNDQHTECAATRCFFVFVGPATIVGEGLTLEEFFVAGGRLVDDDENDFAFHVGAGVIVPVVLRRVNAVSHKHNRRIEVCRRLAGFIFRHDLAAVSEFDRLAARRHESEFRFVLDGMHGDERHFLEVAAVIAGGFEAVESELRFDVFGGKLSTARAGSSAFEQIEREKAHMGANLFRIDGGGCGTGSRGQSFDGRNGICR